MAGERLSPVLAAFDPDAFEIGTELGMRCALTVRQGDAHANFLADLSALRRRLFVGAAAGAFLAERGLDAAPGLFDVAELDGGALLARIHRDQYLLIDGPGGNPAETLFALDEGRHDDVLVLPYEAAEFACGGPDLPALLRELCAADIGAGSGSIWNATRVAHCEAVVRLPESQEHCRITCSHADARFLFDVLRQVTADRDGVLIGLNDFRTWLKREDHCHDTD